MSGESASKVIELHDKANESLDHNLSGEQVYNGKAVRNCLRLFLWKS